MKALFIGLGSVGQRHLQNFIELRPNYSPVLAFRSSKLDKVIKNGKVLSGEILSKYYNLLEFFEIDQALNENPDIAFICNPSSLHIETAVKIAEQNIHLFIEKPLGVGASGIECLENQIREKGLITMVGFQTRFNPVVAEVKNLIRLMKYGQVISAEFKWRTYLPDHHPYEDYRTGYAAIKNLGGGVVFCLIHELDLIQWFFGLPISVYAIEGSTSNLKMDVEDNVSAIFKCEYDLSEFPVHLSLSFSQKYEERFFTILTQEALIKCNLVTNEIEIIGHNYLNYHREYGNLDRNSLFKQELEAFIKAIENKENTSIPVSEGKKSLSMATAIHRSLETDSIVKIKL